jgi:hypothetical protein
LRLNYRHYYAWIRKGTKYCYYNNKFAMWCGAINWQWATNETEKRHTKIERKIKIAHTPNSTKESFDIIYLRWWRQKRNFYLMFVLMPGNIIDSLAHFNYIKIFFIHLIFKRKPNLSEPPRESWKWIATRIANPLSTVLWSKFNRQHQMARLIDDKLN